ncbi:MAG: beta-L-arabinofuranosidase domain-containing protein [Chthonomonadales bacterium]
MCGLAIGILCAFGHGANAAPVWKPPRIPLRATAELAGDFHRRIRQSLQRLSASPYTMDFILADVNFNQHRIFTEYSGDISGRMVSMIARERRFGLPDSWPLEDLLAGLQAAQQADGHFGKPQDLAHEIVGDRDMPILWGNGRLLIGLVEIYEASRNQRALAIARRLGDYYVATDQYLDKPELVNRFGNYAAGFATCYFSGIEGLAGLWRVTHDDRYLVQARNMAQLMMQSTKPGEQHSHGRLCALRGLLDLYIATGDAAYLRYVRDEYQYTQTHYLWPTGGLSEMTVPTFQRDEGCTEADWLRLSLELWRLTGENRYMDDAEWTLKNEMAVNQFPNGGFGHHTALFTAGLMDGYATITSQTAQEAYWCCSEHCPRALLDAAAYAVVARGADVFLNLYEPLTTKVMVNGRPVAFSIQPSQGGSSVGIIVSVKRPARFTLHLRKPAWCSSMAVDGRLKPTGANGSIALDRTWRGATSLTLHFAETLRVWREGQPAFGIPMGRMEPQPDAPVVLFYGPYLLGRDAGADTEPPVITRAETAPSADARFHFRCIDGREVVFRPVAEIAEGGAGFRIRVRLAPN